MEKSHLVHLLRTFDKKEIKELRKWVNSPAHNLRQDVVLLFEYLAAPDPIFSESRLEKEKVFSAVYPDRTYNDAEMRQAMHFLFKTVEDFLVYHEFLKDDVRSQTMLAIAYHQRQLPKLVERTMEKAKFTQRQQPFRNHQYFENEYFMQFEQYNFRRSLSRNVPLNLQEVSDSNDVAFFANRLRFSCILLSHQAVFKTSYQMTLLPEVLSYLENNQQYLEVPAIAVYYYGYKAVHEKDNDSFFFRLKNEIDRNGHLFPLGEIRDVYLLALNYCIRRINAGIDTFVRASFDLYKNGLVQGIFIENGVLSRFTFINAITSALNLKEFAWVENSISLYGTQIDLSHQESYIHFNIARLHFEKREYGQAMKLLAQFDYDDTLMNLSAKTMLLKMYFELDEYNALESLLSSMATYIQRKKVMGYHQLNYKNIISTLRKLLRLPLSDAARKEKLINEIQQTTPLTEKKWLLEQLNKTH